MPLAHLGVPFKVQDVKNTMGSSEDMIVDEQNRFDETLKLETEDTCEIELKSVIKEGCPKAELNDFSFMKILGQGSFGKVYLVKKHNGPDSNVLYAMKVLKKATLKVRDRMRSKFERDILANVHHPFIVKLHYAFQTEGKLYLILDFLKGGDLFSRLSKQVMFTEEDVKFYLAELVLALEHLHSLGIIYRDLKPENVLLGEDGHICLTDFGLSKESEGNEKAFSFCGTIEYMAPEVVNRKGHTIAADWWSFGVLMFEMLTGELPFHAANKKETMNQILKARLAMPHQLSVPAQNLLRNLFKRNPENRLASGYHLKYHCFFATVNFDKLLRKEVKPPFIPTIPLFFQESIQNEIQDSPGFPLNPSSNELFRGFSYVATNMDEDCNKMNGKVHLTDRIYKKHFSQEYKLSDVLGFGTYSVCRKCYHIASGKSFAVKIIEKKLRSCTEEIEILYRHSKHPNIVTLYEVYEDDKNTYLVMELLEGGELLNRIIELKSFSEREASAILEVIANTVHYLHENGVVHRDLKPSNILYTGTDCDPRSLRLCDFGFAKQMKAENGLLMTPCYTAHFAAPEVLKKQGYDEACDVWSMGVILCTMLTGYTPFATAPTDGVEKILHQVESGCFNLRSGKWRSISTYAKDLVQRMLNLDPKQRLSASSILNHEFIVSKAYLPNKQLTFEDLQTIKGGVNTTFQAMNITPRPLKLQPVDASDLARRRKVRRGR